MVSRYSFLVIAMLTLMQKAYGAASDLLYVLHLIDEDRNTWVDTHNYFRRLVSGPEAANMKLMTWDDGLEAFAKTVVSTVGENLYAGGEYRFSQMAGREGITKQWYDENADYTYSTATCESGKECGHYTQVIWANSYKVGCSIARCSAIEGGNTPYLVSCNYGPAGNVYVSGGIPVKPYVEGDSCTQCETGDSCTDQLCSNPGRDSELNATSSSTSAITENAVTDGEVYLSSTAAVTNAAATAQSIVTPADTSFSAIEIANVTTTLSMITSTTAGAKSLREFRNLHLLLILCSTLVLYNRL